MSRKSMTFLAVAFAAGLVSLSLSAEPWEDGLPSSLDKLTASAWQPSLLTAFGTFTYADSALPSAFARYLKDGLKSAIPKTSRVRLFDKDVASAMDPAFREIYGDFFKNNKVDALLAGRYYIEGSSVRARLEMTDLSNGVLIGTLDLRIPTSVIPNDVAVDPSAAAKATASSIGRLAPDSGQSGLRVSVSTERGPGAVYLEGERMVVLVTVNKPSWLKVYHIDATGVLRLIYPNAYTAGKRVDPGTVVSIPEAGNDAFSFEMTPPFGAEFIKVVASTQPFATNETASAGGAAFAELGSDARGAMTRGIRVSAAGKAETAEAMASYLITKR
jgi:hypothetical protein